MYIQFDPVYSGGPCPIDYDEHTSFNKWFFVLSLLLILLKFQLKPRHVRNRLCTRSAFFLEEVSLFIYKYV